MWDKFGIRVSKLGKINFTDFCAKIVRTSLDLDTIEYVQDDQKIYIGKELYIGVNAVVKILFHLYNHAVVNFCFEHFEELICDSNDIDIDIDVTVSKQKIFTCGKIDVVYFEINGIEWYKAKSVCDFLKYSNKKGAVNGLVSINNRSNFFDLRKMAVNENIMLILDKFIDTQTIFINRNGLVELLIKSEKPKSIELAKLFDITIHHKFLRKETEIVLQLDAFCKSAKIKSKYSYSYCKSKKKYIIDYFLIDYKLAIEIDEFDHIDRDQKYERNREQFLKKYIGCKFIRCNPDDPDFSVIDLIGKIHKAIIEQHN